MPGLIVFVMPCWTDDPGRPFLRKNRGGLDLGEREYEEERLEEGREKTAVGIYERIIIIKQLKEGREGGSYFSSLSTKADR